MTTTRKKEAPPVTKTNAYQSNWKGYVNISLSVADKTAVFAACEKEDALLTAIDDATRYAYKFTITYSEKDECYVASLTAGVGRPDEGYCVSARAVELVQASVAACYKALVIAQGRLHEHAKPNVSALDL